MPFGRVTATCTAFTIALILSPHTAADPAAASTNAAAKPADDIANATRRLRVPQGLTVEAWATEPLVQNITSIDFDSRGRAYVVETGRRRTSVFDIRNFKEWVDDDLALRTVEDRIRFLTGQLATNAAFLDTATRNATRGGFGDFNKDGRVDVSDLTVESERLRIVWDSDNDGRADRSAVHADNFNSPVSGVAAGVLVSGDSVWFACIPDIWKLPAAGSDPRPVDKGQPLLSGFGAHVAYGGHDLHGLTQGPDGRIYFSIADRGAATRAAATVGAADPNQLTDPDTGLIFRCDPDGRNLEVYARGLRNPQELAFDDDGQLWTADNNGDGGDKARWTLIQPGSEHGWTIGWQWLPKMGAWNSERLWHTQPSNTALFILPPVAHIGHGPAGIAYYPGTGLGDRFQGSFFYADFPGGVRHFRVEPVGAFYRIPDAGPWMENNKSDDMQGKLLWDLYPVDVAFPPGGGVVVADWIEGWEKTGKGRLWKVSDPTLKDNALIAETARFLREGMSGRAEGQLLLLLGHADLRVRQEAQFELARRDLRSWPGLAETVRNGPSTAARRHAIRALAQIVRNHPSPGDLYDELTRAMRWLDDPDAGIVIEACRLMGEAYFVPAQERLRARFKHPDNRVVAAAMLAISRYFHCFNDPGARLRFKSTLAEDIYMNAPGFAQRWLPAPSQQSGAVTWPVSDLRDALIRIGGKDPVVTHAATVLLQEIASISPSNVFPGLAALMRHPDRNVRLPVLLSIRRMRLPEVATFLEDPDPRLALEAARAIHDQGITAAYKDLIPYLDTGTPKAPTAAFIAGNDFPFSTTEWRSFFLRRSVNAAFRRGSTDDLPILSRAAANADLPEVVRIEALDSLRDWATPPRRDRITGLILPLSPRDPDPARNALTDAWRSCTTPESAESIVLAAIDAARALALPNLEARLTALASHPSASVRKALNPPKPATDPRDLEMVGTKPHTLAALTQGGDVARGRKLFAERADWACQRCHKLNGEGGDVGPDLTGIGKRMTRAQIFEAILNPNGSIAAGYETVILSLKDGDSKVGIIVSEANGVLTLNSPEDGRIEIPIANIRSRERAPSAMPEGLTEMITRGEMRDLIEALARP